MSQPPQPQTDQQLQEELGSPTLAVRIYQERLLLRMFLVFLAAGVPWMIYGAWLWRGHWLMWVYLGMAAYIALISWGRVAYWLPYQVRVVLGLVVIYWAAVLNGLVFGNEIQATIWAIAAVFFGAVFLPLRAGLLNSLIAVLLGGALLYIDFYRRFPPGLPLGSGERWGFAFATMVLLSFVLQGMLSLYRRRLETALEEGHTLTQILEEERQRLEEQGELLEYRVRQIRTMAELAQAISEVMDPEEMLWTFVERVQQAFDLYYVGVFLVQPEQEAARLAAGSGEAGRRMVQEGYRLPLGGGSMIAWAIAHRTFRVSQDVRADPTYFPNPYLPETRSEAAFPLVARGEVLGAVTVQSKKPNAFDEETLRIFQMLADRLATAYANARLFRDLQATARRLEALQRQLTATVLEGMWEGQEVTVQQGQVPPEAVQAHTFHLPLILHGTQIGEILLYRERPWQEEERAQLQKLAQHYLMSLYATLMLRQARLAEQSRTLQRTFEDRLGRFLDVRDVIEESLRFLAEIFRAEHARLVFTLDGEAEPRQEQDAKASA